MQGTGWLNDWDERNDERYEKASNSTTRLAPEDDHMGTPAVPVSKVFKLTSEPRPDTPPQDAPAPTPIIENRQQGSFMHLLFQEGVLQRT